MIHPTCHDKEEEGIKGGRRRKRDSYLIRNSKVSNDHFSQNISCLQHINFKI